MRKFLQSVFLIALIFITNLGFSQTTHVVISEVYGGGGNSGATYKNDFIELYNPTSSPVSLTGWSVQYASATGSSWAVTNLSGSIPAKGYYLIQEAVGGAGTVNLPAPDATGTIAMAAGAGKVALVSLTTPLSGACPSPSAFIDFAGFGSTASCFEGTGPTPAPSATLSVERKANTSSTGTSMIAGGTDEFKGNEFDDDQNSADFITRAPQPQNSGSGIEPDVTAPLFTSGYPASSNIAEVQFDLIVNLDEIGKAYFVVLPDAAIAPTAGQVKSGLDNSGSAAALNGFVSVTTSNTNTPKTISALQPSTSYDVYVVAEDVQGNLQTSPVKIDVTTTASTSPIIIPSLTSIDFSGLTDKLKQSGPQSYSFVANNLTDNVSISVSGNFLVSADNITYASSTSIDKAILAGNSVQTIYVKFNPSGNAGAQVGTILHSSAGATDKNISLSATAIDPFIQDFNDPAFLTNSGWTQYSSVGAQIWATTNFGHTCLTGCTIATPDKAAQINGFSGSSLANEDWLISPQLDLTGFTNFPALSFWTISAFAGDGLKLKYSSDYAGSGDPALATWTDIDGKFPAPNSSLWTKSSSIILPKASVYVAIVYTSDTDAASRWTFDDWKVEDASSYLDVPAISFSFGEVVAGSHSPSQNFSFVSKGYGDVTVSALEGFELSLDDVAFASSQLVTEADASAGKTLYVRLSPATRKIKWSGTINFAGTGLDSSVGSLTGSSYPRSETFDITTYNLEFFGTDVRDVSNKEFGPLDDALQVTNVTSVMQKLGSDIYAVEEVSDDIAFNQLVANLPNYDKILSPRWSYSFDPPDANFPPQKIGFIYNKSTVEIVSSRVMFEKLFDDLRGGRATLPSYPGGTSGSFWSSGRLPFMVTFKVTVNGVTKKIRVIDIHAKSGSASDDYARRKYDVQVLHDSLATNYPTDHIILLGDYNDDVDASINVGSASSFKPFVDDATNFNVLTYALSQAGGFSFPSSGSFLDHIIISNELTPSYLTNSITVEDMRSSISNYANTTSDHLPVTARFQLIKNDQSLTFGALDDKTIGDPVFALTGSASSDLSLVYSTTSDKVTISGNKVTIVKPGRTTITGSQPGNSNYNAATPIDQSFCIKPAKPTIAISNLNTEAPLLTSSASSGNQWYLNGAIIASATSAALSVTTAGVYKVQARVDDCLSAFSADVPIIVTGDLMKLQAVTMYPNPATDFIYLKGISDEIIRSSVIDMMGQTSPVTFVKCEDFQSGNIDHLSPGVYLLRVEHGLIVSQIKFIKK